MCVSSPSMPRFLSAMLAVVAAGALVASGCADAQAPDTSGIDPLRLATVLPTPAGLNEESGPRTVDPAELAAAYGGEGALSAIEGSGLRRAAVRSWTGSGGRRLLVAVGVWSTGDGARYVTGGAAEQDLFADGASAWTPEEIRASRGVRRDGDRPLRVLSFAIDTVGVYVRADGSSGERAVIRAADLLATSIRGQE
jgi:hypothetical protein